MTEATKKNEVKKWWLFEPKSERRKGTMSYVRPAIGLFEDVYPTPSSVWMRIMPPPKVMLVTDHDAELLALQSKYDRVVKALEFYADLEKWSEPDGPQCCRCQINGNDISENENGHSYGGKLARQILKEVEK